MAREIVFDTETTGLNPEVDDRIVELGAVEIVNLIPTGRTFHKYINPERDVPEEVVRIHGLTTERLADEPVFADIADAWFEFIDKNASGEPEPAVLVAHNASFDARFLNAEYARLGRTKLDPLQICDSLQIARQRFPGAQNSLDALCRRFGVDNSDRTFHGALLDSELLAEVYLNLRGGRQPGLELASQKRASNQEVRDITRKHPPVVILPDEKEIQAHGKLVEGLKDPLW